MTYQELLDATSDYASSIQPKTARRDEQFLTRFLTVSKNDVSKAAERYKNYYNIINSIPEIGQILAGHSLNITEEIALRNELSPINFIGLDSEKRGILTLQSAKIRPDLSFNSMVYLWLCTMETLMTKQPEIFENGVVFVIDHGGLTMSHYKMMMSNRVVARIFFKLMDGGFPILVKKAIIVNEPIFFSMIFKFISSFLSSKMKERIFVLGKKHKVAVEELGGPEFSPVLLTNGSLDLKKIEIEDFAAVLGQVLPMV